MHATRTKQAPDAVLRSVLDGGEAHIARMGDYIGAIGRIRAVVPEERFMVEFCEAMFAGPGLDGSTRFSALHSAPDRPRS